MFTHKTRMLQKASGKQFSFVKDKAKIHTQR